MVKYFLSFKLNCIMRTYPFLRKLISFFEDSKFKGGKKQTMVLIAHETDHGSSHF
jgi:hypothetical protein